MYELYVRKAQEFFGVAKVRGDSALLPRPYCLPPCLTRAGFGAAGS